jgi:hypothetical protein
MFERVFGGARVRERRTVRRCESPPSSRHAFRHYRLDAYALRVTGDRTMTYSGDLRPE